MGFCICFTSCFLIPCVPSLGHTYSLVNDWVWAEQGRGIMEFAKQCVLTKPSAKAVAKLERECSDLYSGRR